MKNDKVNSERNIYTNNSSIEIIPIITYANIDKNKPIIYNNNRNKSGISRLVNLISGKSYVGSAINLNNRFRFYYCLSCIKRVVGKESSAIYSALLKYGYSNFKLDILEYCDKKYIINREQYFIDILKPEYNILKIASSRFGLKLSKETKIAISLGLRSRCRLISNKFLLNNKTNIKLSKKTLIKSTTNVNNKPKVITSNTRSKLSLRGQGVRVNVFDKSNNLLFKFSTIAKAALHFCVTHQTISKIFNSGISYDEFIYKFEVKDIRVWVYDSNKELIKILNNAKKVSKWCNIPPATLSNYIKSGKLYKNKIYFYYIKSNPSLGKGN
jgi:group I intron endonuclease